MSGVTAVVVFTAKTVERLLADGGSRAWVLDRNNARRCEFVVCTRNSFPKGWGEDIGPEPHRSAFLVGRVADVVPAGDGRWLITFSEYARLNQPRGDVWRGWRNPVRYTTLDEVGIDVSELKFEPMPRPASEPTRNVSGEARTLTIAEAKRGLAKTFGVSEDAIEITVRG